MMLRDEVRADLRRIGAQLQLCDRPVVGPGDYAGAVFMVIATTMTTPVLFSSIQRHSGRLRAAQ